MIQRITLTFQNAKITLQRVGLEKKSQAVMICDVSAAR